MSLHDKSSAPSVPRPMWANNRIQRFYSQRIFKTNSSRRIKSINKIKGESVATVWNRLKSTCMMIASVFKWSVIMRFLSSFLRCYLSFENVNTSKQNRENSFTIISFASTMNIEKKKKKEKSIEQLLYFFFLLLPTYGRRSIGKQKKLAYALMPTGRRWSVW